MSEKKKKVLFIVFYCLSAASALLVLIKGFLPNPNAVWLFVFLSAAFFLSGSGFLAAYLAGKRGKKDGGKAAVPVAETDDYSAFVDWWTNCNAEEIKGNSLLLGAYQIMCCYNEVCNGGFGQLWDFAESDGWDLPRTEKLFQWLLPKGMSELFSAALQARGRGEDCETYRRAFDYDGMEKKVLPDLAARVANNYKYKRTLTEFDLIEGIAPYLKERGYKKQNKRWKKNVGGFILVFYIQGSAYDKDDYYIRPGIVIENAPAVGDYYGHFMTELKQRNVEQVIADYEAFVREWTDKPLIKRRLSEFLIWEARNPLEKRRDLREKAKKGEDPYEKDPIPDGGTMFFRIGESTRNYILENFPAE